MLKKHRQNHRPVVAAEPSRPEPEPTPGPASLCLRLAPGLHAVRGAEVEVYDNGSRIAGGNGVVEFNLWVETWVEIRERAPGLPASRQS
jgi:hypothetical protein